LLGAKLVGKYLCNSFQSQVSGVVTPGIVKVLEVIEIDQGDGDRVVLAAGTMQFPVQALLHNAAIEKAGERIANRLLTKRLPQPQTGQSQRDLSSHCTGESLPRTRSPQPHSESH